MTVSVGEKTASGFELTCKNCGGTFKGNGSKIKGHVGGGHLALSNNVKPCPKAPKELRAKVADAHNAEIEKKRKRALEDREDRAREDGLMRGSSSLQANNDTTPSVGGRGTYRESLLGGSSNTSFPPVPLSRVPWALPPR